MAFCTECGANVAEEKRFCTECGNPMVAARQSVQESAQTEAVRTEAVRTEAVRTEAVHVETARAATPVVAPSVTAPVQITATDAREQQPPRISPYAVMSVGGYVGSAIFMSIPVIGWLICIIWACGGCKNRNRRNYARATLVFLVIGAVFALGAYLLMDWLMGLIVGYIMQFA